MSVATFRATCRKQLPTRGTGGGGEALRYCDRVFTDPGELVEHFKQVHGVKPFKITPAPVVRRAKGLRAKPAVAPARQRVAPGARFTHRGRQCQVIGHTGPENVAFLVWQHPEQGPMQFKPWDELVENGPDGVRVYRLSRPVDQLLKAMAEG